MNERFKVLQPHEVVTGVIARRLPTGSCFARVDETGEEAFISATMGHRTRVQEGDRVRLHVIPNRVSNTVKWFTVFCQRHDEPETKIHSIDIDKIESLIHDDPMTAEEIAIELNTESTAVWGALVGLQRRGLAARADIFGANDTCEATLWAPSVGHFLGEDE